MKLGGQDISFSSQRKTSVLLVAKDEGVVSQITRAVSKLPKHKLEAQDGTLAGLNGAAVEFARGNDLVIFETRSDRPEDLDAMATLKEELDQKVKILAVTKQDISLSHARKITRAGADEVMTYPFDMEELRDQVTRMTTPNALVVVQQSAGQSAPASVIAVAKSSGGAGGTTVAVNLANELQGKSGLWGRAVDKRVLVLDLDMQFGTVATFLDVDPSDALYRLAEDGTIPDATFLMQSIVKSKCGLDVLSAPARIAPLNSLTVEQVAAMLDVLQAEYDVIVIDFPQALVEWLAPVLERVKRLLMVTDSSVPAIRQARRLIDFYAADNVGLPIDIVVNHEKKPLIQGGGHKEAANVLERPLRFWLPPDPRTARAAVDRGDPLEDVSKRSLLTKAMRQMAKTLAKDIEDDRSAPVWTQASGKAH